MGDRYRHLFGPVPSRRFGRSLGVDLTPWKTCTQDCVFCQLGPTRERTVTRDEHVPTDRVLEELSAWFRSGGEADCITLSGSGEPTLHVRFGDVLEWVRANSRLPAVLLTNGTLLHLPEVRREARKADIVKVSLSAWDPASFEAVNRPHPDLTFDGLIDGQKTFRSEFQGRLWMEVFLVPGMNAMPEAVRKIAARAKAIAPDRIQLNTAVRPPAESGVRAVPKEQMARLVHCFEPTAEIIADFRPAGAGSIEGGEEEILNMLRRRPCTLEQVAEAFSMHRSEASKWMGHLLQNHRIRAVRREAGVFYAPADRVEHDPDARWRQGTQGRGNGARPAAPPRKGGTPKRRR